MRSSWRTPFVVFAIPTAIFVFLGLRLREPKRGVHERLEAGADAETAEIEDDPPGFAETFRVLFQSRTAKRIYYALPFLTVSFFGLATFLSLFYADEYNLGPGRARRDLRRRPTSSAMLALFFGGALVQRFVVAQSGPRDQAARRLGASAWPAGYRRSWRVSPNLAVAIAGHLFASFMGAMLLPGVLAVISFVIPPHMRTLGFATGNLWLLLGAPLIPIVGALGDNDGVRTGSSLSVPMYLFGSFLLSSAGWTIEDDIERVRLSRARRRRCSRAARRARRKLLICRDLDVGYDGVQVLFNVDFDVERRRDRRAARDERRREVDAAEGDLRARAVERGHGPLRRTRRSPTPIPSRSRALGIAQIPGGRAVFPTLTVEENIRIAGWMYRGDDEHVKEATERILEHFPVLRERWEHAGRRPVRR